MRKSARERSLEWLTRRERRRKKRDPIARELLENGPKEKVHLDKRDRLKHKKSIYDWDVVTDSD